MLKSVVLLLISLGLVYAGCDNSCSGHGTCCTLKGVCECYDNWGIGLSHDSGDCSERICPYEIAWVDTPDKTGKHHRYAECAAAGICNRATGECECFPGYEGKGCARTSCPNSCSGHGVCSYIENMPYMAVADDYAPNAGSFLPQEAKTFDDGSPFFYWDQKKTTGCVCDPAWGDVS